MVATLDRHRAALQLTRATFRLAPKPSDTAKIGFLVSHMIAVHLGLSRSPKCTARSGYAQRSVPREELVCRAPARAQESA